MPITQDQARITQGLANLPPGAQLACALGGIDLSALSGFDAVEVLRAQYRQLNHDRARVMAAMVQVGLSEDADGCRRSDNPDEFASDEIRAALVLTRRAADAQFGLAYDLCTRLPAVHAAMLAGYCDEPRARVLSEWTADLTVAQARAVCDWLLPRVGELTTGQLIEKIKKLAIAIDPEWARRRYEHAVAERKVVGSRNPDGSANLAGHNLPVDRVADACARIDALAKAAKHAGSARPIDHLRAELFLGMTDGTYLGLDNDAIINLLLAGDNAGDDTSSDAESPATAGDADDRESEQPTRRKPEHRGPNDEPEDEEPVNSAAMRARDGRGGIELRVRLSTLLGRDRHPAEIAGWGPVHAELARELIPKLTGARWRYVFTDTTGRPQRTGLLRTRPGGVRGPRRGAIVEIQIPTTQVTDLTAMIGNGVAEVPGWAVVLAELRRHVDTHPEDNLDSDAKRRAPGAALRRYLQIRDRHCVGPGCRAPARQADQDHTEDYSAGGATAAWNLGANCRHDYRLQHEGGWQLQQPEPVRFPRFPGDLVIWLRRGLVGC